MADTSGYPGALDGDLRALVPAGTTPTASEDFLQLVADAVAKIETELGTNPSGAAATVAAAIASALTAAGTSYAGGTGMSATDVEAALDELATEKLDTATAASTYAALDADLADFTSGAAPDGQVPTADGLGGVSWEAPSGGGGSVSDTAYGVGWDGDTTVAPSKNAVYDKVETLAPLASPTFTGLPVGPQWQSSGVAGANTTPLTISGANASGAPATGAHVKGEIAGDDTGKLWYCTVAGTPGTWVNVGAAGGGTVDVVSNVAADRILGRVTAGSGDSEELTAAQVRALLDSAYTYTAYTPTVTQNGARTTSSLTARYIQIGKYVHAYGRAVLSDAGTAGNAIQVSLPVAPATHIVAYSAGTGDVTGVLGQFRALVANVVTASPAHVRFFEDEGSAVAGNELGVAPSVALSSGDIVIWNVTYEAA